MSGRIVVVEDDALVRSVVTLNLVDAGYVVEAVGTWAEGRTRLVADGWALAIVDIMLPGGDGFGLVREARAAGRTAPMLMLTARTGVRDKVRALDDGADDYLAKPFDVDELLARVRAHLRRAAAARQTATANATDGAEIYVGSHRVRLDTGEAESREGPVVLSEKEVRMVGLFVRHENLPLSRADILEEVWGMDASPTDRTVDNFILRLRRLFEADPEHPVLFVTLRGRGYLYRTARR